MWNSETIEADPVVTYLWVVLGYSSVVNFQLSSPNTIFPSTSPLSGKKGMEDLAGMDAELKKMAAQLHGKSQWANEPGRAVFQLTISESYGELQYICVLNVL